MPCAGKTPFRLQYERPRFFRDVIAPNNLTLLFVMLFRSSLNTSNF
uniref:Receptor-like protein 12 n=1 Tax=Rhizophora mucronata TaxID=61149 RepID=A0A2P2MEQ3_RHIMU